MGYQIEMKRLNKFIADAGYCSRRQADEYISQGRVTINNKVAILGDMVDVGDEVRVDGERVKSQSDNAIYMLFNKPKEFTTSLDPDDREGLINFFDDRERLMPVGHLDRDDEGLLIMTNDGKLVNLIQQHGERYTKEYVVTLDRAIKESCVESLREGVRLKGEITRVKSVAKQGNTTLIIELEHETERHIRRLCGALGYRVVRSKRVKMLGIELGNLPVGKWRALNSEEINKMERELNKRTQARGRGGQGGGAGNRGRGGSRTRKGSYTEYRKRGKAKRANRNRDRRSRG